MPIRPDFLNRGHALSLSDQPNLEQFFTSIADTNKRVTFVLGAGISIDSKFPSWSALIRSIASQIDPGDPYGISALSDRDSDDLMRKAEHLVEMRIASAGYGSTDAIVRQALYESRPTTNPGQIANSLIDLIFHLNGRAAVMTTNFDNVIDEACNRNPSAVTPHIYSMDESDSWRSEAKDIDESKLHILHLHGRLGRREDDSKGRLILTESHFLKYGPEVRKIVSEALADTVVVFVGLSVTDPNLVGPLWDTSGTDRECYVLSVPESLSKEVPLERSREYAIRKSVYLEEKLKLRTIFLKSYTQLDQLLQETSVAVADLGKYLSTDPALTTMYGRRFDSLLAGIYRNVGLDPDGTRRSEAEVADLTRRLIAIIQPKSELRGLIDTFAGTRATRARLRRIKQQWENPDDPVVDEEFGVVLWLRNPVAPDHAPYTIRYVASSLVSHPSSAPLPFQEVQISPHSSHAASRALMAGQGILWNLSREERFGPWRGVASSLIRVKEEKDETSGVEVRTAVGALALHTNCSHIPSNLNPGIKAENVSILAALDKSQRAELFSTMERLGAQLITN